MCLSYLWNPWHEWSPPWYQVAYFNNDSCPMKKDSKKKKMFFRSLEFVLIASWGQTSGHWIFFRCNLNVRSLSGSQVPVSSFPYSSVTIFFRWVCLKDALTHREGYQGKIWNQQRSASLCSSNAAVLLTAAWISVGPGQGFFSQKWATV